MRRAGKKRFQPLSWSALSETLYLRRSICDAFLAFPIDDFLLSTFTASDDLLVLGISGTNDVQLIVLHLSGFQLRGNFGLQFFAWLLRKSWKGKKRQSKQ